MTPTTYDIYLLGSDDHALDSKGLLGVLGTLPLRRAVADPSRYFYRNEDTGVYFQILLSPEVVSTLQPPASDEDADPYEETSSAEDAEPEEESTTRADELDEPDPEADDSEEDEEDGETFDIEMAPVTLTLPLVCPGFFGREIVAIAERLADGGGLFLGHPGHGEGSDASHEPANDGVTATDILTAWNAANRDTANAVREQGHLTVWSEEKARSWWTYGTHRHALETELGGTGVYVPLLEVAFHGQQIKSLCSWDLITPVVLPRTDLVLIRLERQRKGLLFNRRVKLEGLVDGEMLWNLLAAFSEIRSEPTDLLIFRDAAKPPPQVAAALEVLSLEPLASAQRAELTGTKLTGVGLTWMVDFDLNPSQEERA
jgi:hypothetical protein